RKIGGADGQVPGGYGLVEVLVIIKVEARGVQGAEHFGRYDGQVEKGKPIGNGVVTFSQRLCRGGAHRGKAHFQGKGNYHRTATGGTAHAGPNAPGAIVRVRRIGNGHVQIALVVDVGVGQGQRIVLRVHKGPVVAHRKGGVAQGDHRCLERKVERHEPVVVVVAQHQVRGGAVDRRKRVDDKVHVLGGVNARIVVAVLQTDVDGLPGGGHEIGAAQGARIVVRIGLAAVVGDVVARGGLTVKNERVELRRKVHELTAVTVRIAIARVHRHQASDRTAEVDLEVRKVKTAARVVLDTRIDRLGRRRHDDVNAPKDLVGVVKTVLVALVVLDREKRGVLTAQNVRVVVRQVEDTSSRAVIALVQIDRRVRNGLGSKSYYNGITIYPTNSIYCFNRINSIRSNH